MFTVIGTETYLNEIRKWPKADREVAEKIPLQLLENPFHGKPLSYPFLREKRARERRVYYLIYEDLQLVLLVAVSEKKDQQRTIEHIKGHLDEFRAVAQSIARKVS